MKQSKFIRDCGPYKVSSVSQDGRGVRLEVYPAFPEYNLTLKDQAHHDIDPNWAKEPRWPIHRYKGEGGGPSIFGVMALANEFERFLNQAYPSDIVEAWKATLEESLHDVKERDRKRLERHLRRIEKQADKGR